jgi:hypothetical protein
LFFYVCVCVDLPDSSRVARCVCEKIAQNVAQSTFMYLCALYSKNVGFFSNLKKS